MVIKVSIAEDLSLSQLVYGFWRAAEWGYSTQESTELVRYCIDLGITTFDHADIYGDYTCEEIFGKVLKATPALRDQIEIVTKCGIKLVSPNRPDHQIKSYDTSFEHIVWSAENSLKELETDHIDLLLIHRPDPFINPEEVARAFDQLKAQGKVLHFGVSNFTIQQYKTLSSYLSMPLVTNQIEISATCQDAFKDGNIDFLQELRRHPMAWSPLGGGSIFTSEAPQVKQLRTKLKQVADEMGAETIDQVLLAWLLTHPVGIIPVLGTGKLDRIARSAAAADLQMTRNQWFDILQTATGQEVP